MNDESKPLTLVGREVVLTSVSIGRSLATIEEALRNVGATGATDDALALQYLREARRAANQLSRDLDALISELRS